MNYCNLHFEISTKQTMGIRDFLLFSGTAYMIDSSFTISGAIATRSNLSPYRRVNRIPINSEKSKNWALENDTFPYLGVEPKIAPKWMV